MWERNDVNAGNCGIGLFQLSFNTYKARETIWNWTKNVLQAAIVVLDVDFRASCVELAAHPPDIGVNVFEPGAGLTDVAFDLDVMRRLNTYNKYNLGPTDRYYRWVDENGGPSPALRGTSSISSATIAISYSIDDGIDFGLTEVTHSVAAPTGATLYGFNQNTPRETTSTGLTSPFTWDIPAHVLTDFVQIIDDPNAAGERYRDHQIQCRIGLWNSSTLSGTAQIYDSSITQAGGEYAGFRPPANCWVKFGYVVYEGNGAQGNSGWRDYNLDGVPDIDGEPFGAGGGQNNGAANRSTRYSDICEMRTDEH